MKKIIYLLSLLLIVTGTPALSYATGRKSPENVSADVIRPGCSVSFSKELHADPDDPLSTPPFAVIASWRCRDEKRLPIDRYEINGSSPEVVTVFYWHKRDVVVLVKWQVNSRAADYSGDYYKVFIYKYDNKYNQQKFIKYQLTEKYFPSGFDGVAKDGSPVEYPFKDVASIRKKLRTLDFQ